MAKFTDPKIQEYLLNGGKIKRKEFNCVIFLDEKGVLVHKAEWQNAPSIALDLRRIDLMEDDWIIVEPDYDWNRIIKDKILCQFWDEIEETEIPIVGYLTKKTAEGFRGKGWYCFWKHCRPFNPAEFNIAKNLRDYEV